MPWMMFWTVRSESLGRTATSPVSNPSASSLRTFTSRAARLSTVSFCGAAAPCRIARTLVDQMTQGDVEHLRPAAAGGDDRAARRREWRRPPPEPSRSRTGMPMSATAPAPSLRSRWECARDVVIVLPGLLLAMLDKRHRGHLDATDRRSTSPRATRTRTSPGVSRWLRSKRSSRTARSAPALLIASGRPGTDRTIGFGIRLHVIGRRTTKRAWTDAERLIENLDDTTIAGRQADLADSRR